MARKSLSDILHNGAGNNIRDLWDKTQAAGELTTLPAGTYIAHVVSGELGTSKTKGTAGIKFGFKICEGDHTGRMFWHDCWLTPDALPMTKRDLAKLGITSLEQMERPLPPGIRCKVKLTIRKDDDGTEYNRVKTFEVVGIDTPAADPFAPAREQSEGAAAEPPPGTPADTSFEVAELEKPF